MDSWHRSAFRDLLLSSPSVRANWLVGIFELHTQRRGIFLASAPLPIYPPTCFAVLPGTPFVGSLLQRFFANLRFPSHLEHRISGHVAQYRQPWAATHRRKGYAGVVYG